MAKKVILTGATGMIGSLILEHCLRSEEISRVVSLVRRPTAVTHDKLQEIIIEDFMQLDRYSEDFTATDIVYYCQGVYTGAADRELFRRITIDYPEMLAKVLITTNPHLTFCLLSGAGADRKEKSRMMFAMDKGIIENRLSTMGFGSFHAFRPGYIYPVTQRHEPNLSYAIMRRLYPVIRLLGNNASIKSTDLAEAMFVAGRDGCDLEILENRDILQFLQRTSTR